MAPPYSAELFAAQRVVVDAVVGRAGEDADAAGQVRAAVLVDAVEGDADVVVLVRPDVRGAEPDAAAVGAAVALDHVVRDLEGVGLGVDVDAAALGLDGGRLAVRARP